MYIGFLAAAAMTITFLTKNVPDVTSAAFIGHSLTIVLIVVGGWILLRSQALHTALEARWSSHSHTLQQAQARAAAELDLRNKSLELLLSLIEARELGSSGQTHRLLLYLETLQPRLMLTSLEHERLRLAILLRNMGRLMASDPSPLSTESTSRTWEFIRQLSECLEPPELRSAVPQPPRLETQNSVPQSASIQVVDILKARLERFDGQNSPPNRQGHALPLTARVLACLMEYDSLLELARDTAEKSPEGVGSAIPQSSAPEQSETLPSWEDQALRWLELEAGRALDPDLVVLICACHPHLQEAVAQAETHQPLGPLSAHIVAQGQHEQARVQRLLTSAHRLMAAGLKLDEVSQAIFAHIQVQSPGALVLIGRAELLTGTLSATLLAPPSNNPHPLSHPQALASEPPPWTVTNPALLSLLEREPVDGSISLDSPFTHAISQHCPDIGTEPRRAYLVPLSARESVNGTVPGAGSAEDIEGPYVFLAVYQPIRFNPLSPEDLTELSRLCELAGPALRNALRHQLAHAQAATDPLTGLPNYRQLMQEGNRLVKADAARRAAVCMLDLDGFKRINDAYGHDVGDSLLKGVAQALKAQVRTGELLARRSGDEFAMVLLLDDGQSGEIRAEQLKRAVTGVELMLPGGASTQVGVSIGMAFTAEGEDSFATLLRLADARMYRQKRQNKHTLHTRQDDATLERQNLPFEL